MSILSNIAAELRRLGNDTQGNVAIITAGFMTVAVGCLACAVDLGNLYYEKRRAQAAVDLAAMAGAQLLSSAQQRAADTLARNRYAAPVSLAVATGTYTPDAKLPVGQRFEPGAGPANAARVTMVSSAPLYFMSMFTGRKSLELRTTATATSTRMAMFSIGSRLAAVEGGVANALLSQTLGTSISLSVMDYNALLGAKVDLFQFSRALATQLALKGVTFNELASASMKTGDVYAALAVLANEGKLNGEQRAVDAINVLAARTAGSTPALTLGKLLNYGPYGNQLVSDGAAASAQVGLLDLVNMAAMVANGQRQIQLDLGAQVPGLLRVVITLQIGERMVTSPWLTLGGNDVVVRTAQTRLYLDAQVGGTGVLAGASVAIPLYLELASAEARRQDVVCGSSTADTRVTLSVLPSIAEAWLGKIDKSAMSNFTASPTVSRATMVNLSLVTVTGAGHVRSGSTSAQNVVFTYDDVKALAVKTVSSSNYTSSLVASLLGHLDLNITVLGLGLGASAVSSALASVLSLATPSIDSLLQAVFGLSGVKLGQADVVVNGVRCDGATLAQ